MNFKETITSIPNYKDGCFSIYEIANKNTTFPEEYLKLISDKKFWFEEKSISDKLRFEAEAREVDLTFKIRIAQDKTITSKNVLKIGNEYHKVFNVYHFTNADGFKQSDITLQKYENPILEEEKNDDKE